MTPIRAGPVVGGPVKGARGPIDFDDPYLVLKGPMSPADISFLKSIGREDLIVWPEPRDWEEYRRELQERLGPGAVVRFQDEIDRELARQRAGIPERDLGKVFLFGGGIVALVFLLTM